MSSPNEKREEPILPEVNQNQQLFDLIRNVSTGDQMALAAFYDQTNRLAFGLILKITGDRATAEEVLLDVYTQVWRQAVNYNPERGSPLAWVMTIARSRALDRIRAGRQESTRKESLEAVSDARSFDNTPEEIASSNEQQKIVRQALSALTPEQRQAIELAFFSGLSHSEIAEHLGQPLGTVKTRIRLGMMKLKEHLSPRIGSI